jgi:hypothetical protein
VVSLFPETKPGEKAKENFFNLCQDYLKEIRKFEREKNH